MTAFRRRDPRSPNALRQPGATCVACLDERASATSRKPRRKSIRPLRVPTHLINAVIHVALPGSGFRLCGYCDRTRAQELFTRPGGRSTKTCTECLDENNTRINAIRRLDGVREKNLRQKYGITPDQYDALRVAQDYRCAICGTHEDDIVVISRGRPRKDGSDRTASFKLVVDHCHKSSRVRGLLCAQCNLGIGSMADNPTYLRAAADYCERNQPTN
ncbi:endonuclease VII domain-containing protein [Actinoplanes oblitus]|uniref:endonuclease VII domain-containing protein n=1 Tax=Actinoplanes oblitus TaxID=3040509 RepID=UPI003899344B